MILYGRVPIIELAGRGTLLIERLDQAGRAIRDLIGKPQLVRGSFFDFAKAGWTWPPADFIARRSAQIRDHLQGRPHCDGGRRRWSRGFCGLLTMLGCVHGANIDLSRRACRRRHRPGGTASSTTLPALDRVRGLSLDVLTG